MECPECQRLNPEDAKFCNECGCHLISNPEDMQFCSDGESERKHVTVMFCDLSGYTTMTERLDPEEVKEIMSHIFGKITEIIINYDGFIERFIGDAVMAVFGIPQAHEDDPVRAIRAAIEIKAAVEKLSPQFEGKIGHSLTMHTGINTGLVVTGQVDVKKGTHGLTGDAINLASRLEGFANAGEIIVGPDTYNQAMSYFEFKTMEPVRVKGKAEAVRIYEVLAVKELPDKLHRTQGVRAGLVGRNKEMGLLIKAVNQLCEGQGSIVTIVGDAGTGKSRLLRELKAQLDLKKIRWHEGHAFGYTQNTPYFPLVDLLTWAFKIEESDNPDQIRSKIKSGLEALLGPGNTAVPYIGGLFSLDYPEAADISPEFWKKKLFDAIHEILRVLVKSGPTVLCFEDLHWADPSSVELIKKLIVEFASSALFVCAYRPIFKSMDKLQPTPDFTMRTVLLKDLPDKEAQAMLRALLQTESVPAELTDFVSKKAEGNPFYLEEVVNTLIESEILIRDNGIWMVARPINKADIPSTINGVLAARIDRLGKETKRIVQEASVIGRAFFQKILEQITDIEIPIDHYLKELGTLDLVRVRSFEPEIEYIFKHVLTQEVVYGGLLKKERRKIHIRIGLAVERLFADRLPEFYEVLAYHFKAGQSNFKAIHYLMKAGGKCLKRYAVEEAHDYYQTAYDLLSHKSKKTLEEKSLIVAILIDWALVFYYRGFFGTLSDLLIENKEVASSIEDKDIMGMYYAWLGFTLDNRFRAKEAYEYLHKSLQIGEEINNESVIGYACTWLTWACSSLGLYDESIIHGNRAQSIARRIKSDPYIHFKSLAGIGLTYFFKGEVKKAIEAGQEILKYGQDRSNIRSQAIGYYMIGYGHCAGGNFEESIDSSEKAIQIALDPFYKVLPNTVIGLCHIFNGHYNAAKKHLEEIRSFGEKRGFELMGIPSGALLAAISVAEGQMTAGLRKLKDIQNTCLKQQYRGIWLIIELIIGQIYAEMITGPRPRAGIMMRNIGFLIKNLPFAEKRAQTYLTNAIEAAQELGANGTLGQAYFSLGTLYKAKKKMLPAKECVLKAIDIFRKCEADGYTHQALELLESLN